MNTVEHDAPEAQQDVLNTERLPWVTPEVATVMPVSLTYKGKGSGNNGS